MCVVVGQMTQFLTFILLPNYLSQVVWEAFSVQTTMRDQPLYSTGIGHRRPH